MSGVAVSARNRKELSQQVFDGHSAPQSFGELDKAEPPYRIRFVIKGEGLSIDSFDRLEQLTGSNRPA